MSPGSPHTPLETLQLDIETKKPSGTDGIIEATPVLVNQSLEKKPRVVAHLSASSLQILNEQFEQKLFQPFLYIEGNILSDLGMAYENDNYEIDYSKVREEMIMLGLFPYITQRFKNNSSATFPTTFLQTLLDTLKTCPEFVESFIDTLCLIVWDHPDKENELIDFLKNILQALDDTLPQQEIACNEIMAGIFAHILKAFPGFSEKNQEFLGYEIIHRSHLANQEIYIQDLLQFFKPRSAEEVLKNLGQGYYKMLGLSRIQPPSHRLNISEYALTNLGYGGDLSRILRASSHEGSLELKNALEPIRAHFEKIIQQHNHKEISAITAGHLFAASSRPLNLLCLTYTHDSPYAKAILGISAIVKEAGLALLYGIKTNAEEDTNGLSQDTKTAYDIVNLEINKVIINYTWLHRIYGETPEEIDTCTQQYCLETEQAFCQACKSGDLSDDFICDLENAKVENCLLIQGFGEVRKIQCQEKMNSLTSTNNSHADFLSVDELFTQAFNPTTDNEELLQKTTISPSLSSDTDAHSNNLGKIQGDIIKNIRASSRYQQVLKSLESESTIIQNFILDFETVNSSDELFHFFCKHFPLSKDALENPSFCELISFHILPNIVHIIVFAKHQSQGIHNGLILDITSTVIKIPRTSLNIELYANIATNAVESFNFRADEDTKLYSSQVDILKRQLDTAGYHINEMPSIPRLYLAMAHYYASLPHYYHEDEWVDENIAKAGECLSIYIEACGGNVPEKYLAFYKEVCRRVGSKQLGDLTGGNRIHILGEQVVHGITKTNIQHVTQTGRELITQFQNSSAYSNCFHEEDFLDSVNNDLCINLAEKVFRSGCSMELQTSIETQKTAFTENKKTIPIQLLHGRTYHLVFTYPKLGFTTFDRYYQQIFVNLEALLLLVLQKKLNTFDPHIKILDARYFIAHADVKKGNFEYFTATKKTGLDLMGEKKNWPLPSLDSIIQNISKCFTHTHPTVRLCHISGYTFGLIFPGTPDDSEKEKIRQSIQNSLSSNLFTEGVELEFSDHAPNEIHLLPRHLFI